MSIAGTLQDSVNIRYVFTISGTPTTVNGADDNSKTLAYTEGQVDVYLNGVKQVVGTDVTATSGSSVVFGSALAANDVVEVVAFDTFQAGAIAGEAITSGTIDTDRVPITRRNYIINGDMRVAQRGTSTTSGAQTYLIDRFYTYQFNQTGRTVSQVTDAPDGFQNALKVQRAASQTTTTDVYLSQPIETKMCQGTAGQDITLSFYAKKGADWSKSGGTFGVSVYSGTGTDQSLMTGLTGSTAVINTSTSALTTSWARYEFTGSVPSNSTQLVYQSINGWSGTAGADDSFYITGIQLEVGTKASHFKFEPYDQTLRRCQRYYYSSEASSAEYKIHGSGTIFQATNADIYFHLPVATRSTPTVATSNTVIQAGGSSYAVTGISEVSGADGGLDRLFLRCATGGTMTVAQGCILTNNNNAAGKVTVTSEL